MLEQITTILSWGMISIGAFFMLSGSLGILRMPDFFTRLHPAGVTDSFAAPLLLFGVMVHFGFTAISAKIFLLIVLLLITGPTATHILAQSAVIAKLKPLGIAKK